MKEVILTSRKDFTDIDGVACVFAMKELNDLLGIASKIVLPKIFNSSVSKEVYNWIDTNLVINVAGYDFNDSDVYLLDISDREAISEKISPSQVKLIFDHHLGFEEQWKDFDVPRLAIEKIGAAATLVFEEFERNNLLEKMSANTANLLYLTIKVHTIDLSTNETNERDKAACEKLKKKITITHDVIAKYYKEREHAIMKNLPNSLTEDMKRFDFHGMKTKIVQCELWDANEILGQKLDEILNVLKQIDNDINLINFVSISQQKSYLYSESESISETLSDLYPNRITENILASDRIVLRKELVALLKSSL